MDSEGSFSTIGASADHKDGPARFSTGGGLGRDFDIQEEVVAVKLDDYLKLF
jgi:hypothetical protein